MRLLHSGTLDFAVFDDENIPPYALLSQACVRDSSQEVSFEDMIDETGTLKSGYQKISKCGEMASNNNLDYFWVDTCCIHVVRQQD
jgi:hypothetical protein